MSSFSRGKEERRAECSCVWTCERKRKLPFPFNPFFRRSILSGAFFFFYFFKNIFVGRHASLCFLLNIYDVNKNHSLSILFPKCYLSIIYRDIKCELLSFSSSSSPIQFSILNKGGGRRRLKKNRLSTVSFF